MSDEILIDLSESERKLSVDLDEQQREELIEVRDHHDKPYMREKAAAILKVADNWSARAVAKYGLHKTRRPNTVRDWIHQYRNGGIDKLTISEGRGRKPAFSPEV